MGVALCGRILLPILLDEMKKVLPNVSAGRFDLYATMQVMLSV
jgi:hypothetical protein